MLNHFTSFIINALSQPKNVQREKKKMEKVLDKKKWKKRKLKILIRRLNDGTKLGLVCSKCDEALNVTKDFHI